jgi:putative tryptophan/tyrosine transport system substrate-binding protein
MIDRRTLVVSGWATAALPALGLAQAPLQRPPGKIGYIHPVTISPSHTSFAILQPAWQKLGYVDGQSVLTRSAQGDLQKLPGLVTELIAQGAGVLIVVGADAVRAAAHTTRTTPIVAIDLETDPVRTGLVASYAKPGGNVTGLFLDLPSLASKWIELLLAAVPGLQRIALVWQPSTGREQLDIALDAAKAMGVETVVVEITPADDFDAKFAGLAGGKKTGIVQLTLPGLIPVAAAAA